VICPSLLSPNHGRCRGQDVSPPLSSGRRGVPRYRRSVRRGGGVSGGAGQGIGGSFGNDRTSSAGDGGGGAGGTRLGRREDRVQGGGVRGGASWFAPGQWPKVWLATQEKTAGRHVSKPTGLSLCELRIVLLCSPSLQFTPLWGGYHREALPLGGREQWALASCSYQHHSRCNLLPCGRKTGFPVTPLL
jgi:hypothetical protein